MLDERTSDARNRRTKILEPSEDDAEPSSRRRARRSPRARRMCRRRGRSPRGGDGGAPRAGGGRETKRTVRVAGSRAESRRERRPDRQVARGGPAGVRTRAANDEALTRKTRDAAHESAISGRAISHTSVASCLTARVLSRRGRTSRPSRTLSVRDFGAARRRRRLALVSRRLTPVAFASPPARIPASTPWRISPSALLRHPRRAPPPRTMRTLRTSSTPNVQRPRLISRRLARLFEIPVRLRQRRHDSFVHRAAFRRALRVRRETSRARWIPACCARSTATSRIGRPMTPKS